jgi:omega-6 fatty acid desaturase (delta-12 desaturase)
MEVMEPFVDGMSDPYKNNYHKFPIEKPKFTIADLRKAIPPHCFEHSLITSFYYLIRDCVGVAVVGYLATYIDAKDGPFESLPYSTLARSAAWLFYFWLQGCIMTGLWVLAHECGHGGFSKSTAVNNTVGTIFHSLLMVPYHPWRITHAKHHQNTGSCEHDEVFAPVGRADMGDGPVRAGALANLWGLFITFTLGWLPGYLVFNATGPIKYRGKNASHFSPDAEFFKQEREERALVYQSKIAFFVVLAGIGYACKELQTPEGPWYEGMLQVFKYYYGPLAVVNYHLVLITFLQHTDVYMPHFRGAEWDWFRGACCTIDRSYGKVQDIFFHHITDTHVVHHLFSYMPFYHASEATEHVKKVMGDYYMRDETHYLVALWRSYSTCLFVEDDEDIVFFKNKK